MIDRAGRRSCQPTPAEHETPRSHGRGDKLDEADDEGPAGLPTDVEDAAVHLRYIDTGNPHWTSAVLFLLAAVIAISLTWWFFGNDE